MIKGRNVPYTVEKQLTMTMTMTMTVAINDDPSKKRVSYSIKITYPFISLGNFQHHWVSLYMSYAFCQKYC